MTSMDDWKPAVFVLGAVVEVLELVVEDDFFAGMVEDDFVAGVARVVLLGRMAATVTVVRGGTAVTVVMDCVEGGDVPLVVVMEEMVPPSEAEAQPAAAITTNSTQHGRKAPTNLRIALPCCCWRPQPGWRDCLMQNDVLVRNIDGYLSLPRADGAGNPASTTALLDPSLIFQDLRLRMTGRR
jgi:hypothetical protein